MPTYSVHSPIGQLSGAQRAAVAAAVTRAHSAVTGAQGFFAQVVFTEVAAGSWFMGGVALAGDQVHVCGHIRGGRPAALKTALILALRDAVREAAGVPGHCVWVYLVEIPPAQMVEYGHVLPEAGEEAAWLAGLPEEDRQRLLAMGRS